MNPIVIRRANKHDSVTLHRLVSDYHHERRSQVNGLTPPTTLQEIEKDGFGTINPAFFCLLADVANHNHKEPIGMVMYYYMYSTWHAKGIYLKLIFVDTKFRRQGVGRKLMESLAKFGVDENFCRIMLTIDGPNEIAMDFFRSLGGLNLSKDEGWLTYSFDEDALKKIESEIKPLSSKFIIRDASESDCDSIAGLIKELAVYEKMGDLVKISGKELLNDGFKGQQAYYKAKVVENLNADSGKTEVIGYALWYDTYDLTLGRFVHLEDLYVTPKYRKCGLGQQLFASLAKVLLAENLKGFTLECLNWNELARQFYLKNHGQLKDNSLSFRFPRKTMEEIIVQCSSTMLS